MGKYIGKYIVQLAIIKEIEVEASDVLQAQRVAFDKIGRDRDNAVAMLVLEKKDGGGALQSDEPSKNWAFAKKHFETVDLSWVCK